MRNLILAESTTDGSLWMMTIFFIVLVVGMYVFSSRSQKKRQAKVDDMIAGLEVGSKIKTIGGILGVIEVIGEDYFVIKTGEGSMTGYLKIIKNAVYASDEVAPASYDKKAEEVVEVVEVEDENA
ncbi:MAG: preprotein translocase subunit YajC [Bacillota bacterium]